MFQIVVVIVIILQLAKLQINAVLQSKIAIMEHGTNSNITCNHMDSKCNSCP